MVKYRYLLILFLLNVIPLSSQETKREFSVDFRVNSIEIDTLYNDNSQVIKELKEYISTLSQDTTIIISDLSLSAFAVLTKPSGANIWTAKPKNKAANNTNHLF